LQFLQVFVEMNNYLRRQLAGRLKMLSFQSCWYFLW